MPVALSGRAAESRATAITRALVAVLLLCACTAKSDNGTITQKPETSTFRPLVVGDSAPAYDAITLAGDSVHIGGGGQPVTVMNIWATWCTSCREEMSDLEAVRAEFGARGVRVLAVSVDATEVERVRDFVQHEKLMFSIAHDPDGIVQQRYQVVGIPSTYVVGRNGRLLWKSTGNIHPILDSLRGVLRAAAAQ